MTDFSKDNPEKDIEQIVQQFVDAQLRGENPDIDEFVKQYPGLEDGIRQRIHNLREIDGLFASLMQPEESDFQDTPAEHDLIGQKLGDFEIVKLIGRGGMGAVFLAHQISLDRDVALKVVSDISGARGKSLERFKLEAKVLAKISHPNIVPIYEVGEQGPYSYFAMEHIKGVSLDKILTSIRNAKPGDKASDIMRKCLEAQVEVYNGKQQTDSGTVAEIDTEYIINISKIIVNIASALDYAHKIGILHRDVKPSNILIDFNGTPKLVDFGLARAETQQTITISGEFFGTPNYVSPEQINKPENVDCRSDVYSLAATYYECLTLHPPFEGNTINETLTRVISREAIPPKKYCPRLSTDFNTVLLHALEKSSQDRYQNAADFAADIENVLEFKPITAKRPSITQRTYKTIRRNPLKVIAVSAFTLVVILGYFFLSHSLKLSYFEGQIQARQQTVKQSPGSPDAHYSLGIAYAGSPHHEKAIQEFKRAIELKPHYAEAYSGLGMAYCESKNYDAAIEAYKEAIRIKPDYTEAYYGLGVTYFDAKKYKEAVGIFKYVVEKDPNHIEAFEALGIANERLGNYSEASENIKQSLIINPPERYKTLGLNYSMSDKYDEATDAFKKALELDPNDAKAYALLGSVYTFYGRHQDAIESCLRAINLDSECKEAYYWLGRTRHNMGDYGKAVEAYRHVLSIDPQCVYAYVDLGMAYAELNAYEDAITAFNKALKIEPNDAFTYNEIGTVYHKLGFSDKAVKAFKDAIRIDTGYKEAHANLGFVYQSLGHYEEAIESCKQALKIDPNLVDAYNNLGLAYYNSGNSDKAIQSYKQALTIEPNYARAYCNLGVVYDELGRQDDAIKAYERAITIDVNCAEAHYSIGTVYYKLGRYEEAIAEFKRAIELKPDYAKAYCVLGMAYDKSKNYDAAMEAYEQAIKANPNDVFILNQVGAKYSELGSNTKALLLFEQAVKIDPNDVEVRCNLGFTYRKLGRYRDAGDAFNQSIKQQNYFAHAYHLSAYLYATCPEDKFRDGHKAVELAQKACELSNYENKSYLSSLAAAYAESGNFEKAVEYQKKAIELGDDSTKENYEKRLEAYKAKKPWRE